MKLYCPQCGHRITAEQINLASSSAVCPSCNNVFGFAPLVEADQVRHGSSPMLAASNQPALTPRPPRMHVQDWAGLLTIRWRWFNPSILSLTLFCIAWDSFLFFWYKNAFTQRQLILIIFPIAHVGVGATMTYGVLCGYLNSTTVTANSSMVQVRHGPLPWAGRALKRSQIRSLYCRSRAAKNSSEKWELCAILCTGQKLSLVSGLSDCDEPVFIQRELEARLGLHPEPIPIRV